jgi:hypothetical protein
MTLADMKDVLRKNPPKTGVSAVTIGTIKAKDAIANLFAAVDASQRGGDVSIRISSAEVIIPAQLQNTVELTGSSLAIKFPAKKPRIRIGSGWLGVSQEVSSVEVDNGRSLATLGIAGCPDLCFTLE